MKLCQIYLFKGLSSGKFWGIIASSICSWDLISFVESKFLVIAKFDSIVNEINTIARVQVVFSKKSVVFFAPIIWLLDPPPKVEERPPPFGFWTKTTSTNRTDVMMIKIANTEYILFNFIYITNLGCK